ncbi:MAG: hypothetical protein ACYC1Q_14060 [Bacteroidia bacterium]
MNHLKYFLLGSVLLAAGNGVFAQDTWGVGVRLGDPSGISIKKYTGKNALELSIGRTYVWGYRNWYNDRFHDWYIDQHYPYKDFQYIGYRSSGPLGVQLHYLFNNPIKNVGKEDLSGLQWYYGIGAQFRFQTYDFDYRYKLDGDPDWHYAKGERVTNIDLGVDGVLGLEYRFKTAPFSVFADVTLFMEVIDDPFLFWSQGGLGVRYNF